MKKYWIVFAVVAVLAVLYLVGKKNKPGSVKEPDTTRYDDRRDPFVPPKDGLNHIL